MRANWFDDDVMNAILSAENAIVEEGCALVTEKAKDSMRPGSYRRWKSKKGDGSWHWSSAPGTPPAPDTEELRDSISYATSGGKKGGLGPNAVVPNVSQPIRGVNSDIVSGRIGTQDAKGLWHELGTILNSDKRPFLRPALYRSELEIMNIVGKHKI